MQNFTPNDLMLYVFNEAESEITMAINVALKNDTQLANRIQLIREDLEDVQQFNLNPNPKTMSYILKELHEDNHVELV